MSKPRETLVLRKATGVWAQLAGALIRRGREPVEAEADARRAVAVAAFLRLAGAGDLAGFAPALVRLTSSGDESLDDAALWSSLPDDLRSRLVADCEPLFAPPLAVEILGRLHEQLLGRRLSLAGPDRWTTVAADAAKRTRGVFYTPPPIAAYIAERALTPGTPGLRLLDPACGCGVFLLAAYRRAGMAAELHGVDLDPEAVLIARRSLWLEMDADGLAALDHSCLERVRCGDAITDPDLDAARGRFDAVIGNPPYRRELGARDLLDRLAHTELGRRCRTARMDLWYYFLHRGLELLRPGGRLGYIVGSYWTAASGAAKLIAEIRDSAHVDEIVCLPTRGVFPKVTGRHVIVSIVKQRETRPTVVRRVRDDACSWQDLLQGRGQAFEKTPEQLFRGGKIDLEPPCDELLAALGRWPSLGELGVVRQGIAENPARVPVRVAAGEDSWRPGEGVFVLRPEEAAELDLSGAEKALLRPYHVLADLGRYWMAESPSHRLVYSTAQTWAEESQHPVLRAHLVRFRRLMELRRETRLGRRAWWHLHWPREEAIWHASKLIAVQMGPRPAFVPALGPAYVPFSVNVFLASAQTPEHLYYLAGLLNSRLLWKWYEHHAKRRGVGLEINGHVLAATPIRRIDMTQAADRERHDTIVRLVGQRMELEQRRHTTGVDGPQIESLETELERRVCELYGVEMDGGV
jgi:SAM-dependent methyltransferase